MSELLAIHTGKLFTTFHLEASHIHSGFLRQQGETLWYWKNTPSRLRDSDSVWFWEEKAQHTTERLINLNSVVRKHPLVPRKNIKTYSKDKEITELKSNSNLWLQKVHIQIANTKITAKVLYVKRNQAVFNRHSCLWKEMVYLKPVLTILCLYSLFLVLSFPLEMRLSTKSNLVHKAVWKPQDSLVLSHRASLGSNLAELFALEIKWVKIKMDIQQF